MRMLTFSQSTVAAGEKKTKRIARAAAADESLLLSSSEIIVFRGWRAAGEESARALLIPRPAAVTRFLKKMRPTLKKNMSFGSSSC
jgi:hypothetical protein